MGRDRIANGQRVIAAAVIGAVAAIAAGGCTGVGSTADGPRTGSGTDGAPAGSGPGGTAATGLVGVTALGPTSPDGLPPCPVGGEARVVASDATGFDDLSNPAPLPTTTTTATGALDDQQRRARTGPDVPLDWDRDGTTDELVEDPAAGTLTLRWRTGQLVVTGVQVDVLSPPSTAPSAPPTQRGERPTTTAPPTTRAPTAADRPYAVDDLTGDGWPDLAVASGGTVAVLPGAGTATPTGSMAFGEIGSRTFGFRVSGPLHERSRLVTVFDVDGDRVDDLRVVEPTPAPTGTGRTVQAWYVAVGRCSTAGAAGTAPTTTLVQTPVEPCTAAGYLDPELLRTMAPERYRSSFSPEVYVTEGNDAPPGRPFDWNGDGSPDRIVVEGPSIVVDHGSGRVVVTDVRTDFSDLHPYETIRGRLPIDVGDVTGDDDPDLLVATGGRVGILVGRGGAETTRTVSFADIPAAGGWIVEPREGAPSPRAEPHVGPDIDGDGIADIDVWSHGARSSGSHDYTLGRPCRV